jgi:hypothetical protein
MQTEEGNPVGALFIQLERRPGVRVVVLAMTLVAIVVIESCADRKTVCGSIRERLDAAAPGATVDLPDGCVYRESTEVNKPVTLVGGPGVWIKGSDVWTSWTKLPSGLYRSERELPAFPHQSTSGDPDQPLCEPEVGTACGLPEQVFVNGSNLRQVHTEAAISPGDRKFRLNASNRVVMGVNPTGETVEVSVRNYWLRGGDDVDDVTIRDIRFAHAANGRSSAALKNGDGGDAWVVRDCDIGWSASLNISLNRSNAPGKRLVVADNRIHHGGQEGLAGGNDSPITISGNEIYENNIEGFNQSWDAGGVKISDPVDLVVHGNEIHHNTKGFWSDGGGRNITFTNNVVHHNLEAGVHFEITDGIVAHGNVLYENGWGPARGSDDSGEPAFKLVSVRNVDLYDNVLAWNEDSIVVVNSVRDNGVGATDPRFDGVHDVHVHDNDIISNDPGEANRAHYALAWLKNNDVTLTVCAQQGATCLDEPGSNNGGHDNRYWYPSPEGSRPRFVWGSELNELEDFNRTRGEERGRYLSDAGKVQVLAAENVPAKPE